MKVSQLIHAMDRDDDIYIYDYDALLDRMRLYSGAVRGIKKDNPINKMVVMRVCVDKDAIHVLARKRENKEQEHGIH